MIFHNFFVIVLQLMYDPGHPSTTVLRKYMSINLSWWHTLKHVIHKTWKAFANDLFGPLWHTLYPSSLFFIKSQSPQDELLHMLHVVFSYPTFRKDLQALRDNDELSLPNLAAVHDLFFLCEYAIPSVGTH